MAKERVNWALSGMTCAGCAHSAHTIAEGMPGISEVQVRYASGAFKATIDTAEFDLQSLKENLAKAGYGLTTEYRTPQERIASQHAALLRKRNELILATTLALPLLVIGMMHLMAPWVMGVQFFLALALTAYFGRHIHKKAFQLALNLATNMDTLVSLGSLVAFTFSIVGWINHQHQQIYFESAGLIIYFILIGKYLEDRGKASNSKALAELIALQPQQALRVEDGKEERVPVEALELDQFIRIQPAERVPVDGIVVEGISTIDESTFTGEPLPVDKKQGSKVWAGTLNGSGGLLVQVTHTGRTSALGNIIDAVVEAQGTAAPIEALTDRISKIFVPTILALSLATGVFWHFYMDSPKALIYAIDVLVIACPCALGLATPLAMVAATGMGSKNGLLIKNAAALQTAQDLKFALLDKTGTLTLGAPTVLELNWPQEHSDLQLQALTALNSKGTHPLNHALAAHLAANHSSALPTIKRFKALPGKGIQGKIDGLTYYLGSANFFREICNTEPPTLTQTHSLFFTDEGLLATVSFEDALHPDAPALIQRLHDLGIVPIVASGDTPAAVAQCAAALGLKFHHGGLLPQDKLALVQEYQKRGRTLMLGDGINDAIALNAADIGMSMAHGTAVAQESADIVLTREGLPQIPQFFVLSRLTMHTIKGNLWWAFGYNIIAIPIAAGAFSVAYGLELTPMMASIAMSFSSLGVVANSLRMHNKSLSK